MHVLVNVGGAHGHLFLLQFGILAGTVAAGFRSSVQLTRVAVDLEQASRAAMTDPLTGARNRAFCEQLALASTDVVALVDFDDFKRVNDELGHPRGDRLLVDFVLAARSRLRTNDHVVRLGGDEFALVLRQVDLRSAHRICLEVLEAWKETSADVAPLRVVRTGPGGCGLVRVGARPGRRTDVLRQVRRRPGVSRPRAGDPPGRGVSYEIRIPRFRSCEIGVSTLGSVRSGEVGVASRRARHPDMATPVPGAAAPRWPRTSRRRSRWGSRRWWPRRSAIWRGRAG